MTAQRDVWRVAAHTRDRVGEGPVWMHAESALYWVDILGQAVTRLSLADGALTRWSMPEPIGFIVPRQARGGFVAGLQTGIYALCLEPLTLRLLASPEPHLPDNRFNDGKADRLGRLWAGTMPMDGGPPSGTLYCIDPDMRWQVADTGYRVCNGPAFSPAQDRLYHADSPRRIIYRFDLDGAGGLHDKTPFIRFPEAWGLPDGMAVDTDGYLWVAHWDGGRISRFDPDGGLDRAIALPARRITSCAFGGTALDRLFVTSASEGRTEEPLAGALFEVECPVRGTVTHAFGG